MNLYLSSGLDICSLQTAYTRAASFESQISTLGSGQALMSHIKSSGLANLNLATSQGPRIASFFSDDCEALSRQDHSSRCSRRSRARVVGDGKRRDTS